MASASSVTFHAWALADPFRARVVSGLLQSADVVWIACPIQRAVDESVARNMLQEQLRRQLFLDGKYADGICVLATRSDEVSSASELLRNLQPKDP